MAQLGTKQFMFNDSIPNEKDLDKLRKQHNYQYYQSINGMTEIMSDGERIISILKPLIEVHSYTRWGMYSLMIFKTSIYGQCA